MNCSTYTVHVCRCAHSLGQSQDSPLGGLSGYLAKQQSSNPLLQLTILNLTPGTGGQKHCRSEMSAPSLQIKLWMGR